MESEEETHLIPTQLIGVQGSLFAGIVDNCTKVFVLDAEKTGDVRCVELAACPVAMTIEGGHLMVMTMDTKLYKINVKEETIEAEEVQSSVLQKLVEMGYRYEKSVDDEESGELFKRVVKKRFLTSGGLEKQFEHDRRVYSSS